MSSRKLRPRARRQILNEDAIESDDSEDDEASDYEDTDPQISDSIRAVDSELHRELHERLTLETPTPSKRISTSKASKRTAAARAANPNNQNVLPQAYVSLPQVVVPQPQETPHTQPTSRRQRITNKEKVHDSEHHAETSCWSACHVKKRGDVHADMTVEAWRQWLDKCVCGVGRLERGDEEGHLHLQAWFRTHSGTTQTDINAMRAAWRDHFSCVPSKDFKSSCDPFKGNQKEAYMTGYVGKTLQNKLMEHGTTDMIFKGDQFTDSFIDSCIRSYTQDCPKDPNAKRTTYSRNNLMLYCLNFKNRFLQHLRPMPSLARTLHIMTCVSGKYIPASNFLSTGYPMDRARAEHLWQVLNEPSNATKVDLCEALFINNDSQLKPVLDVPLEMHPQNCPFPNISDVDHEGDPYPDKMLWQDYVQLNQEMAPHYIPTEHDDMSDMAGADGEF